jgi:hypothetical protein
MSWVSVLKTIGTDIEAGIQAAAPIIDTFVPEAAPILTEIAAIIAALESVGTVPSAAMATQLNQSAAAISAVKQFAASKAPASS